MCVLNRWVRGPDEATPEGGADCETGRGLSLQRAGGGRGATMPWQQQRQQRADVAADKRPEVCSGLGSSVESALSEDETQTNKLLYSFISHEDIEQFKWESGEK